MLSIIPERPLDPNTIFILSSLQNAAKMESCDYFVIGATARDIIMTHVFNVEAGRATRDVDFAIALRDWDQFDRLKKLLISTGRFSPAKDQLHRLYFDYEENGIAYPLDLIPFGGIEQPQHEIAWPPDMEVVMSVAGYQEALEAANDILVTSDLSIRVVSLPGLAALKLLAWADRGMESTKDAQDLYFLLKNYEKAGNNRRIYDQAIELLAACEYDIGLAGAALLGHDTKTIMSESTLEQIHELLNDPIKRDRLVLHMHRQVDPEVDEALSYLEWFERGLSITSLK